MVGAASRARSCRGNCVGQVVVVTGAAGLLGAHVTRKLVEAGHNVTGFGHGKLDVADRDSVLSKIAALKPDAIVHCAAMTDVDACETDPDSAFAVNADGSRHIAEAASEAGAELVAVSTDYVFDGKKGEPYSEDDHPRPIQVYGTSKLRGEEAVAATCDQHYIVRSAWIYGPGGKNFLSKLPQMTDRDEIKAVVDQVVSPTYAPDLAQAICDLLGADESYGTYHVVNEGQCTIAEFCREALVLLGARTEIVEVNVGDLGLAAPRPLDTRLANERWKAAGFTPLRDWREAAADFCAGLG